MIQISTAWWGKAQTTESEVGGSNPSGCASTPQSFSSQHRSAPHTPGVQIKNPVSAFIGLGRRVVSALTVRTVDSAIARWLEEVTARADDLRPASVDAYRSGAGHLSRLLGARPLDELTDGDLDTIRHELQEQRSLCRRVLWILQAIRCRAREWGWPVSELQIRRRIPTQELREIWLPPKEAAAAIVRCYELLDRLAPGSNRNGVAGMLLCLLTGGRVSEICKARREDVHLFSRADGTIAGTIRVPAAKSKSRRARSIPLSTKAATVVAGLLGDDLQGALVVSFSDQGSTSTGCRSRGETGLSPWLLPSGRIRGRSIGRATVTRQFRQLREDIGLGHYRVHDLRHTFGTLAVQNGADLYKVQEALGHTDAWMTRRYAHLQAEHIVAVAEIVAEVTR